MGDSRYTGVLLYPRFSEYELSVLLSVLKQGGKRTIFLGLDDQPIRGEAGLPSKPEATIHDFDINLLDSIVLPGVDDFEHLVGHQELAEYLHKVDDQKRVIAAISSAPYLLSMGDVLAGKTYTTGLTTQQRTFLGTFEEENYVDAPVVVDDYLVTARGSAFIEFAFRVGDLLGLEYDKTWFYPDCRI
ncbi:DJ-1/PfpI family protein [Halobacillus salinus]|uniref:4-methyl-5(B-hydroxyethyl)-thiazole monophosphate biosynthesis protein n=1 Tax=Halobacillus salinus TaxID=192814 RepID=A0A4Z0H295_9BACI|nr:DJ-1/PfpI family protein [Halobacillus salinus]TGB03531.1 4-methyl-5(B-hydroxyethyl)-thiazole monophosphate biosynthesis protein [Halobacillus salinus]